jgi:membrane-associated protein
MAELFHNLKDLIRPEHLLNTGGPIVLLLVIFAETGLFFGFFFPGDSLLFTAGLLCGTNDFKFNIVLLVVSVFGAAVLGNTVGYWFGYRVGPRLFKRDDSLIFKKKYLDMTQSFYDRYGKVAVIAGRFLPIIRTFVPILAGAIKLDFKKFMLYNIIGAAAWVSSFILLGYFLGAYVKGVKDNLDYIVIGLVIITIIPVIRTYFKEKRRAAATPGEPKP